MPHILDSLKERGFIAQITFEERLYELFEKERVTFYVGFDPTADSLHVGHFIPIMAMAHLQRAGHRPIALMGGGTGMIGDPSGRTDLRKMLTEEMVQHNVDNIQKQLSRLIDFGEDGAILENNAHWLMELNYIAFLREVGVHFSVNRMLTAECYKQRMEQGLTFLEFNYMLMQAYDFWKLNQLYDCKLEVGGDDQWSNILAGADLIRRKEQKEAFCITFPLLTNSQGKKMGKTAAGAMWLDANKMSPYDFYQYWRNVDDADVEKCLKLLTFLPLEEIRELCAEGGASLNHAKEVLATEVTKLIHGETEAMSAHEAAKALFGKGGDDANIPTTVIDRATLAENGRVVDLLALTGVAKSKGEGRRLIAGGGVSVNGEKVTDVDQKVTEADFAQGLMLKKGKKVYHRVVLEG